MVSSLRDTLRTCMRAAIDDRRTDVDRFGWWASTYDGSYLQNLVFEPVRRALLGGGGSRGAAPRPDPRRRVRHRETAASCRRRGFGADRCGADPAERMIDQSEASRSRDVDARFITRSGSRAMRFRRFISLNGNGSAGSIEAQGMTPKGEAR